MAVQQSTFSVKIALAAKILAILSLVMVLVESRIPGMFQNASLVTARSSILSFEFANFDVWVRWNRLAERIADFLGSLRLLSKRPGCVLREHCPHPNGYFSKVYIRRF